MVPVPDTIPSAFVDAILAEGIWRDGKSLERYARFLFRGVPLRGKRTLDIGGGTGLFSFLAASSGASEVVCMEPEAEGSSRDVSGTFRRLMLRLGHPNVSLVREPIQEYRAVPCSFDIVLLHNSVNHLDEEAYLNLGRGGDAGDRYRAIFEKLHELAAPGAFLVITDSSPRNFYTLLGIEHPVCRNIEWNKHQPPELLIELLREAGFESPDLSWSSFNRLGRVGWWMLANRIGAYFFTSHFRIRMEKPAIAWSVQSSYSS